MIGYLLNTVIFIISGTIIGKKWADDGNVVSRKDLLMGLILYAWVHVARAVALFIAQPFVQRHKTQWVPTVRRKSGWGRALASESDC